MFILIIELVLGLTLFYLFETVFLSGAMRFRRKGVFMKSLIDYLEKDHSLIKNEIKILKDSDASFEEKNLAFKTLIPVLKSHTKAEEVVVYTFMADDIELRSFSYEGNEEHGIVDRLAEKIHNSAQLNSSDRDKWSAQAKVLAELIEHHLKEEEGVVFPKLKKSFSSEKQDQHLAKEYLEEYLKVSKDLNMEKSIIDKHMEDYSQIQKAS